MLASETIRSATGFDATSLGRYWPTIVAALQAEGIASDAVLAAAAATLRVELGGSMTPVAERSPVGVDRTAYFESKYGPQTSVGKTLGNTLPGHASTYFGRGFIQLTGRDNYLRMGQRLGVDLISRPDMALEPYTSARIFAAYMKDRGVAKAAEKHDWRAVRRLVNGGYNGWDTFIAVINRLQGVLPKPGTTAATTGVGLAVLAGLALAYFALRK